MQMVCEYISSLENSTRFAVFKSPPSFHETYVIMYNGIQGMGYTRTPILSITGPVLSGKTGMVVSLQDLEYEKVFTGGY